VNLEVKADSHHDGEKGTVRVKIKNPSATIAFQVHLRLANSKDGDDIVPIFWDDNYFSLLPGEEKSLSLSYDSSNVEIKDAVLEVSGFNIAPTKVKLTH
jgi:exo-1,4-beta-D-glucosaminidase